MTLTHDEPVTGPARFRLRGQDDLAPSGTASRVTANLATLRLLRLLEREDRPAAPEEQAVLARWSGWGAVPQVFDDDHAEFAAARAELHQLLSETECAAARRTTINAHYTDAALAKVVWDHVTALGSGTGQVLEPGCGSGNFIGLAPPGAQVLGVELDPVTAAVAARLYPDAEIRCESFADTRLPDGHFDLVVGNVPFSAARLHDRRYNAAGHSMHNHFIIKSLKFLKPGGLLAVLTSRYTMDAQDPAAREEMAGLASLVTAVRLPSGAHRRAAGTEAVTDLLILRRADAGTPGSRPQWRRAFETSLDGGTAWINEYWRDHPENVLGSFTVGQGQYNDHDLTVRPSGDLSGVASQLAVRLAARPVPVAPHEVPAGETDRFDGTLRANDDGSFSVLRDGFWQDWPCPATQAGELRDLLGLRDTVAALLDAEGSSPDDTPAIAGLRAELNRRYDAYAGAYGPVNRTGWKRTGKTDDEGNDILARHRPPQGKFSEDPYAAAVYALEDFDPETGQAAKSVIFTQRVVTTRQTPESASDPADAVAICMDQAGEVRIEDAARLLGSASADEARTTLGELVYDEPGTGRLVPAAEYLSGKVRAKLREAGQAAGDDPRFDVNVAALRRALPADLGPGEIDARLGASWIDWRYVQQGLREILEDPRLTVEKGHGTSWTVTGDKTSVLATQVWGTEDKDAVSLAACLLEQRPVKVSPERSERDDTPRDKHQKRLKAAAATVTARAKADELNRRFGEWLWENPARTADLVKTYNERFNSLVLRSYDGARPALPGLAAWFREWVHPHQLAAVARIINEPAVLLAHDVGAGKTAEMAMGAMELRRLGLAAKPAIVVPNHMLEQFQREFLQLYPQARVLAAGNDDLRTLGRHTFVARIATGNWDAVIMSQSVFERIPMSAPEIERYISAQLAGYDAWLERAREASQSKRMIKKMETRKLMREQRLRKKLDRARDGGICWEQTGIDYLFVDEAHHYKNLDIRSNNSELDIDGSGRASDLEMKLDYLRTTHGRRVVTFATATPIANSMTEAYVMCRYLRPDLLADAGIEDFDAWVGTFAATTTDVEVAPEGGIRVKDRFARFRNIPELLNMWRVAADVKTKEDLKLPVPELIGGKPEVVPVEPPEELLGFMQDLARRAEAVRSRAVLPDEDNMLKISNDGRLAALDPRLAGLGAPETGKLDVAAQNIARIEREYCGHRYYDGGGNLLPVTGSLQIVFCDLGTPGGKSRWNAYEYLRGKLAGYGTDPRTVRFMHEAKTDKAKAELFAAARAGKVAVLVGSTSLMGVGTNVQDLAVALHHLDCPWRPADVAQREGRILRQRNKHPRVHIYRYVTERSFDAYMWQTVTRKAKFIDQVIHGKTTSRDAEDVGGEMAALSYSEVTALATGDMRILAKAKADSDVRRLEDLESAWQRTRQHLKTKISDNQRSVTRLTDVTAQLGSAIERRVDTRGDAFTMRLDGQAFSKRTDAAACLRSLLHTQISQAKKGTRPRDDPGHIGMLGGFTIISTPTWGAGNSVWAHLRFDGVPVPAVRISETELGLTPGKPPVGLITRLENKLADLGTDRDKVLQETSRIQAETERARTAIGAPFAHADELARARTQSDRLAEELSGQPSAAPPPASGSPDADHEAPDQTAPETEAAHTAAAGSDPGHRASTANPATSDRGTGSASDPAPPSQAPGPATPTVMETDSGRPAPAPAAPLPAPGGLAEPAEPVRRPAGASQPVPAPAPAGTGSREDHAVAPEAAPAPLAHDPGHPADQDQPTAGDPAGEAAAGLIIEHHQQSTLVHGTQKNDHQLRRMLRNHGFRWSGNLNAWFLPRPWTFSTRAGRVRSLTTDLRQAHRSFTMRTQPPAPAGTDDSPPEPLPAAGPYTDIRQGSDGDDYAAGPAHPEVRENPAPGDTTAQATRPDEDREGYIATSQRAATTFQNGDFEQALTLLDQAELLYPGSAGAVACARDKVHARMQQPETGDAGTGRQQPSAGQHTVTPVAGPDTPDEAGTVPAAAGEPAATAGETTPVTGPEQHHAAGPPEGTQPLTGHTAWAGAVGDNTATRDKARATTRPAHSAHAPPVGNRPKAAPQAAATPGTGTRPAPGEIAGAGVPDFAVSPPTNSDLAAELRRLPGFARWFSLRGTPPAAGDLDAQCPGAGSSAACDARGIEITVSGPDFTRHGLVTWPQAASWIDNGVTPARLGLVIIADRLSTFCRTHRDQLIAAGTSDPDAAAAELGQIRDTAVAMIVDAASRSRGAAKPVPPAGPDDPAWYTTFMITRPDRTAGRAENAALERLTRLRMAIREPQPATAAEVRATIRRWTRHGGLPDLVRGLDNPAAMRAWISEQASRRGEGQYDSSGERWYGSSPDGLITDRNGDDRAPVLIRWEEIPAWIQPGITSSQRDRLLAADDATTAIARRRVAAAVNANAGLTAPGEEEGKQAGERLAEAADAVWAAIEAAPPPSPADLENACHVYRGTGPVQPALFDDPQQDSTPAQDTTRASASRQPRRAPSRPAVPAGTGRQAATADAPLPEEAPRQDPPARPGTGTRHTPSAGPPGQRQPGADRPEKGTAAKDQAANPSDASRASGTPGQNPTAAAVPASAGPAHADDREPPQTPTTNSAPPPSPANLDHARTSYQATGTAQQALPGSPAKTGQPGRTVAPAPRPEAEPRPAAQPRPVPSAHGQDELPAAAAAGLSDGTRTRPRREPAAALKQPTVTSDPLTDDDIFLGIGRLPAFVIGDLFHAVDAGQPLELVSRQLTPYSGERAAGEPDPGAREAVTPGPAGLRIQVDPAGSRRTGLITWRQIDDLLRPGMTPARRQIVTQAWQVRVGFMAANASFRAAGESHLAAAAADELRAQAAAAVTAILAAAHPAADGQAPQTADEDATARRIADLAATLPSQPPRSRTPAGQVTTGDIIGHPGYRFQPFRVAAPPRHTDAAIEITGRLTEPAGTEPPGPITLTLPHAGRPGPVVSVIPVPARSLRPLFPGHDAAADTAQPAGTRPDRAGRAAAETAGTPSDAVPAPDAETPASEPDAPNNHSQEETMPPAADSTAPSEPPASAEPSAAPHAPTAAPAPPETAGQRDAGRDSPRDHAAARPEDGTSLTDELERVLDAIRERRRAAADGHASHDDFSDIRGAFAAMRDTLGLSTASAEAGPGQPAPAPAAPSRPPRGEPGPAPEGFTDIQAAFADLQDILGLPARGRHARSDGPPDGTGASVADALDQAAAEAQACARWYRDTPEWQRISTVGRAARDLITAIRETAGDYWAEIRLDIRVRGFARTLAARTALAVSGAAHVLAGRLERAGHRDSRIWRAAWRLHQATTTFADRIMRYAPPGSPDRMGEARRIIDDLGQRQNRPGQPEPGRHAAPRRAGGARTPNAAALASASFPVMVTRANARQATAAPAARTAGPAPRQPAARRQ